LDAAGGDISGKLKEARRAYVRACALGGMMRSDLRRKAIAVCDAKIAKKGEAVGLSFYAFFANRNEDPERLMEAAEWWIKTHQLDHFERAVKIRAMIAAGQ